MACVSNNPDCHCETCTCDPCNCGPANLCGCDLGERREELLAQERFHNLPDHPRDDR